MPLPDDAVTLHGGCNCRAIRYQINIPKVSIRPLHPLSNGEIHFPLVVTDHCNDCRRATGAIIPTWMCVPASMMSVSFRPAPPTTFNVDSNDGPFLPAMTALREESPKRIDTTLRSYISSPARTRTFCGHCGTNLTYAILPMLEGFPDIFDVVLGTFDRKDLQKDWLIPDRQLWWDHGIGWVQKMTSGGLSIPRHPTFKPDELIE